MFSQAAQFLLQTVEFIVVYPALLRFYLQLMHAPARNPISNFVMAITDFAVKPLRKLIPGVSGMDMASLVWAWLAEILLLFLFYQVMGATFLMGGPLALPGTMFLAFIKLIQFSLHLLVFVVIVQAILSWVSPYHPMRPVFDALTNPFLRPVRRFVPLIGGVDLSPLIILVICQLLLFVLMGLEQAGMQMILRGAS